MEKIKNLTPQLKFCVRLLAENGITADIFTQIVKTLSPKDQRFRLIPWNENFFTDLAKQMRELWPIGKKDGKYDWRDSVDVLATRLKWLWEEKELGDYSIEDCLLVCRKYLARYQHDVRYMKLLKYFIIKQKPAHLTQKGLVHVGTESEFANMLLELTDTERQQQEYENMLENFEPQGTLI